MKRSRLTERNMSDQHSGEMGSAREQPLRLPHRPKDFHPGYSRVLMRTELKERFRQFRQEIGLHESHYERCLISAGIELLLSSESMRQSWLNNLAEAAREDAVLATSAQQIRSA